MGKYGKKNVVSLNPLDYNICLLGESGIGKSTLAKEVCEKLVGDEGYLHFDIGREDGRFAIQGIVSEPIEDFEKLKDVTDDIIENKETDYPDLKVVIWDTLDELIPILETETVREYNKGKSADKKADTINAAYGGFQRGQEHAINYLLDIIWELKKVGVSSIIVAHVKRSDIIDPITQETFSKLTADTTQKYFNWIKNKMHFIGLAYIDREIVKETTGRKDIKGKDIVLAKAAKESRVISFRDNTYSVDSKSRFADIVDSVPFDTDKFIEAIQNAIAAERSKGGESIDEANAMQAIREKEKAQKAAEYSANVKQNKASEELELHRQEYIDNIASKYTKASDELKKTALAALAKTGCKKFSDTELDINVLKEVSEMF